MRDDSTPSEHGARLALKRVLRTRFLRTSPNAELFRLRASVLKSGPKESVLKELIEHQVTEEASSPGLRKP